MADFGHEAESNQSGGTWHLAAVGQEDGLWCFLLLTGPAEGWATFSLHQNKRGAYFWQWDHSEFNHITRMEARRSFATRALCLASLFEAMSQCHVFGGLITDMEKWG